MSLRSTGALAVAALLAPLALAQGDLFVYPKSGQTQEQQDKDTYECYGFAKNNSGFDPMAAPTASSPKPEEEGGVGRGALGGALLGAAVGAIADGGDGAATGAAIGGIGGGLFGGMKNRNSRQEQEDWERQQQQQYASGRNNYNRAFAACMEGRDYTVR